MSKRKAISLIVIVVLAAGFLGLLYSTYTGSSGTVASLAELPVGTALIDFPSTGPAAYHKGMAARDLRITVYARADLAALQDWVQQRNGHWREQQGRNVDLGGLLSEDLLNEIGFTTPFTVDRSFVVQQLPGGIGMSGEVDTSSGWCWLTISR